MNFGEVITRFTADVSGFVDGVGQAADAAASFGSSVASSVGAGIGNVLSGLGDLASGFLSLPSSITGAVGAFSQWIYYVEQAPAKMMAMASSIFDEASAWQQFKVQLSAFTGSADSAATMMEQLHQFALATPFELPGIVSAAEKLMAMGTAASDVIPILHDVAGAVYAVGGDTSGVEKIINALDRMRDTGQVTMASLRVFIASGIPVWQMFADALQTDVAGAMAAVKNGSLGAEQAIQILLEGMRKMGDPALAQFGATWAGAVNNATSAFEDLWRTLTTPIMQAFATDVNSLATALSQPAFASFASSVGQGIVRVFESLGTAFEHVRTWLSPVTQAIGDFMGRLSEVAQGFDFASMLSALHGAFQMIGLVLAPIPTLLGSFITNLDPGAIVTFIHGGIDLLVQAFQGIMAWLSPIGEALSGLMGQFANAGVIDAATALWDTLGQVFQTLGTVLAPVRQLVVDFIDSIDVATILSVVQGIVGFADAVATRLTPVLEAVVGIIENVASSIGGFLAQMASTGAFETLANQVLIVLDALGPFASALGDVVNMILNLVAQSGLAEMFFGILARGLAGALVLVTMAVTGFSELVRMIQFLTTGDFSANAFAKLGEDMIALNSHVMNAIGNYQQLDSQLNNLGANEGPIGASAHMQTFVEKIRNANGETQQLNGTWITLQGTMNKVQVPDSFQFSIAQSRVAVDDLDRKMGMLGIKPYKINLDYASITTAHTEIDALGQGLDYLGAPHQINLGYASITTAHQAVDSLNAAEDQLAAPRAINLGYASITSAHQQVDTLQDALNQIGNTGVTPQVGTGPIQSAIDKAIQAKNALLALNGSSSWIANLGGSALGAGALHTTLLSLNGSSYWTATMRYNYVSTYTSQYQTVWLQHGGLITEPVVGIGTRSGARYVLGEGGPEAVTPLGSGSGSSASRGRMAGEESRTTIVQLVLDRRVLAEALASEVGEIIRVELGGAR